MSIRAPLLCAALFSAPALAQDQPAEAPAEGAAPLPPPEPESWLEGWTGSVELGLNGSTGNTERLNLRGGVTGVRKTSDYESDFFVTHAYALDEGRNTESKTALQLKNQWLFEDSPWRFFALGRGDHDRFQDWEYRLSGYVGPAYEVIKDETTTLVARAGLGVSREFKGADEDWHPEALLGADFEHKISERQKISATTDIFPSLDEAGEFRAVALVAWELLVDPETNMSLKVGATADYDSNVPSGTRHADLDYFALLVWNW